ncbi:MAG: ABC transporter ATP-binding protein [Aggregatilineales bacterium]
MNTTPAIQTSGLTKFYQRGKVALDGLNLTVQSGEIFGYLGPNGAGKTTTIRLLLDIIRPNSGSASLLGLNAHTDSIAVHRRIGFLPGELNLWNGRTGRQVINYLARIRGGVDKGYVQSLTERLSLDLSKSIRSYSSGNRRKLGLIIALMHKPDLLILDEPTNGLDPLMQQTFHELMVEARNEGRTVFLSSHILSEVQQICERVAILRDGKLQAVERVTDLTRVQFHWVTFRFRQPVDPVRLKGIPGVSDVSVEGTGGDTLRFRLSGDFDPVMRAVNDQYLAEVRVHEPSLEEIFLTYYGGNGHSDNGTQPKTPTVVSDVKQKEVVS